MPRDLEVWAVSDDGEYVLLATSEDASRATHQLRIDSRLEAAVRGDLADDDEERRESELSPKEIQARLRAGDSVEEVAKAARVALLRIQRYAGPVISERERIVDQARAAVLQRPRGPQSETPLGRVVERRLAETVGLRPETVAWSARRRDDGAWIVALSYTAKGGSRTAQWLWQPGTREINSINALGTRLGAEDAVSPKRRRPAAVSAPVATKSPAVRSAPVRRPSTKPAPVTKPVAKKAAPPRPAAPKRAPSKQAASKRAVATKAIKATKAAPAQARKRAAAAKPVRRRRTTPAPVVTPVVTRDANGRVVLPSWDDVLLGVRSPASARGRRRS